MKTFVAAVAASVLVWGCSNVTVLHSRPIEDADGAFLSQGYAADSEYMASQCPNGYYTSPAGYGVASYETSGTSHNGFVHATTTPIYRERIRYTCAPPYVPAGQAARAAPPAPAPAATP